MFYFLFILFLVDVFAYEGLHLIYFFNTNER